MIVTIIIIIIIIKIIIVSNKSCNSNVALITIILEALLSSRFPVRRVLQV